MPTTMSNQASATYTLAGSTEEITEVSNENQINLINETGISVIKSSNTETFVPGQRITFYVSITNTGSQWFSGVRITDNLSGTGYLTYVPNSASLFINGQWLAAQIVNTNPLVATLSPLSPGENYLLRYEATVNSNIPATINSLTNSVEGIGYTYNSTVTGNSSLTLERATTGSVTILKTASDSSVTVGQVFNYQIAITNSSNETATLSNIQDQLPEGFVITSVSLQTGSGVVRILDPSDYTVSPANEFNTPTATGQTITVPANGTSTLTIYGYFSTN